MSRKFRLEARELAAAEAMGPGRVPPAPRPASGLVLVRDRPSGPEVLLVRRRSDVGFAAGAFVFPGGTLDEEDGDPSWDEWLRLPEPGALVGAVDPGDPVRPAARAFVTAALREGFEETGVLVGAGDVPPEVARERAALVAGRRRFLDIIASVLRRPLDASGLVLCARWITPEALSRRYDARFFLAVAPPAVEVTPETGELVEHIWIAPDEALERYFENGLPMLFPTARTLGWLAELPARADDWLRHFRETRVEPILPRLRRVDGSVIAVVPGDPLYEAEPDG